MRAAAVMVAVMWGVVAHAAPGDLPVRDGEAPGEAFEVLPAATGGHACAGKPGTTCWAAGARTTVAVASEPLAAAPPDGGPAPAGVSPAPRFARAASAKADGGTAWTLELSAALKRPTWPGNLIVMLIDTDDPEAVKARQFTGLYQATVKALKTLTARVVLSPDEGYRAGHTYRAVIVQLINGKEILLAEGDVTLL